MQHKLFTKRPLPLGKLGAHKMLPKRFNWFLNFNYIGKLPCTSVSNNWTQSLFHRNASTAAPVQAVLTGPQFSRPHSSQYFRSTRQSLGHGAHHRPACCGSWWTQCPHLKRQRFPILRTDTPSRLPHPPSHSPSFFLHPDSPSGPVLPAWRGVCRWQILLGFMEWTYWFHLPSWKYFAGQSSMVAVPFGDTGPHAPLAVTVSGQGAVCLTAAPSKVFCLFPTAAFTILVSLVLFGLLWSLWDCCSFCLWLTGILGLV